MRRSLIRSLVPSIFVVAAACGGQSSTDVCVKKLDVQDVANVQLGATATLHAQLSAKAGKCATPFTDRITWNSANAVVLQLLTSNDSVASVKGLKAGTSIVTAFLTLQPSVRDSVSVSVLAPVDSAR